MEPSSEAVTTKKIVRFNASCGIFTRSMVAIYDERNISTKKALHLIETGKYNHNILRMRAEQFDSILSDILIVGEEASKS